MSGCGTTDATFILKLVQEKDCFKKEFVPHT